MTSLRCFTPSGRARGLALALVLFMLVGCKEKKPPPAPSPTPTADQSTGSKETTARSPANEAKSPESLDEGLVTELVRAWEKAQNEGNFAAYSKLYAQKFVGVKRAGTRVTRFDRKGWLSDRGRMFEKPMTVAAKELDVASFGVSAEVQMSQEWKSGTYEDVGPKRLLIVKEDDALRIAREEMLSSQVKGSSKDHGAGNLYFILDGGLELQGAKVPETYGAPRLTRPSGDRVHWEARAEVKEADLEKEVRALKGLSVRVDNDCEATITGFGLLSRVEPHFGQVNMWQCQFAGPDCSKPPESEVAEMVFEMGRQVVIAQLDGCQSGQVARFSEEPRVIEAAPLGDPKLEQAARDAFANHPLARAEGDSSWWKTSLTTSSFVHPTSHQKLIVVSANNGAVCDGAASLLLVWAVVDGKLAPHATSYRGAAARRAFDTDADGALELLLESNEPDGDEWILWDPGKDEEILSRSYAYMDCPC